MTSRAIQELTEKNIKLKLENEQLRAEIKVLRGEPVQDLKYALKPPIEKTFSHGSVL